MADLLSEWRAALADWHSADAAKTLPLRTRNRMMLRVRRLGSEIAEHDEMRSPIIELCSPDQDPDLRLGAALIREHWDPSGAAETLMSIISESGASVLRPLTMSRALEVSTKKTALSAALCLFNIDEGRGNV